MSFQTLSSVIAEVRVIGIAQQQAIVSRFDFAFLGTFVDETSEDLLQEFRTRFRAQFLPLFHAGYLALKYEARSISGSTRKVTPKGTHYSRSYYAAWSFLTSGVAADQGQLGGAPLPTWVAVTIQKRTGLLGKKFRGSLRASPIVETDTDPSGNNLTITAHDAWVNAMVNFGGRFKVKPGGAGTIDAVPAVFSAKGYFLDTSPAKTVVDWTREVVAFQPNVRVGSQGSRRARRDGL